VLSAALGNLREEIYKTEAADYKIMLKQRESLMKALQGRLSLAETSGLAVGEPVLGSSACRGSTWSNTICALSIRA
jgi:hypothetical protein